MIGNQAATITEEEAELYDRQIRLWGLDSQKRLRQARVLLSGLGSLGTEVAKNVILAGVKSLTLMDSVVVRSKADVATNFTLTEADIGKNRAVAAMRNIQKLNPMVEVSANETDIAERDEEFFKQFDVVCVIGCTLETARKVDELCAKNKIHFIMGDSFGFFGFAFFDFGIHEYSEEVTKEKKDEAKDKASNGEPTAKKAKIDHSETETVTKKKVTKYGRLTDVICTRDETKKSPGLFDLVKIVSEFKTRNGFLPHSGLDGKEVAFLEDQISQVDKSRSSKPALSMENILNHCSGEFAPSCAIIGGVIGQEVIKAVSQRDAPLNNFFLFDGTEGSGYVQKQEQPTKK